LKWGGLPRIGGRKKNGSDDWSTYYQSASGYRPALHSAGRRGGRSSLFRVVAVLIILAVLVAARQAPHPLGEQVRENLRYLLTAEWNFQPLISKSVQLAAQLVNWDNPVLYGTPGAGSMAKPVAGSGLTEEQKLCVPVSGKVVREFGWVQSPLDDMERFHAGIDISAPKGATVVAALGGRVERIGTDRLLGRYILIAHGGGTYTLYGGVADPAVVEGQLVQAGEVIAVVDEGDVPGGGLHFELREGGKLVNPLPRLQGGAE